MIELNDIIDELLSFEKQPISKPPTLLQRVHNFAKRKEIEKGIQDEIQADNQRIIKAGDDAQVFLNSTYYLNLIEPQLRQTIKGNIQTIIRDGIDFPEVQLKCKIAEIKEAMKIIASLKLKIVQAEHIKESIKQ